jgi:large subunit ribosomal protein L13
MKYHLLDAKDKILGRLATEVALILSGKRKVEYKPNICQGEAVVVINSDKVRLSGMKADKKIYYRFSGYPSGIKAETFSERMKKDSRKVIIDAVAGMLPKNKLRKVMIKNLFVYKDEKHSHKIK